MGPVCSVGIGEQRFTIAKGCDVLRVGTARTRNDVLDHLGAGRGAIRYPQLVSVRAISGIEQEFAVTKGSEVSAAARCGTARTWINVLDEGDVENAVRHP